jgi:NAD(P)-dependent dehydrogenase (short-subunit alcohol dehydrogenase family)
MDLALRGKRALVTGSSRGIGAAIAKALAREGVSLVVHGRSEGDAARVASEIEVEGGKAAVALGDLSTDDGAALARRSKHGSGRPRATKDGRAIGPTTSGASAPGFCHAPPDASGAPRRWRTS